MKKLFALTFLFSFLGASQLSAMDGLNLKEFEGPSDVALQELARRSPQKSNRSKRAAAKRYARDLKGMRKLSFEDVDTHRGNKTAQQLEIFKNRAQAQAIRMAFLIEKQRNNAQPN